MITDEEKELINKLKEKDPASFEIAVRLHTGHLFKTCLGLGFQDHEADDITQSVWVTFFDIAPSFEGRSSLRTFLFGILYKKASEYRKQNQRASATENIEDFLDSHFNERGHWILSHSPSSPDKFLEDNQIRGLIEKCIELLPVIQRMAFVLKEIEEEITEEVCNILNITATHLGVLLFRARNQLRECMDRKVR